VLVSSTTLVGPLPDRRESTSFGQRVSAINGNYLHALELNGLRNWEETAVRRLAEQWNMLLISAATAMAWSRTPTST